MSQIPTFFTCLIWQRMEHYSLSSGLESITIYYYYSFQCCSSPDLASGGPFTVVFVCFWLVPILMGAFLCLLAQEDVVCSSYILWAISWVQPFLQRVLVPFIRTWYVEIKPRHALCSLLMLCTGMRVCVCTYTHPAYTPLYIYYF